MSDAKRVSIESIVEGITQLYVNPAEGTAWTTDLATIRTAALLDIAKSLRSLVRLANCGTVAQGYRAMEQARRILARMDRRRRTMPRGRKR